MSDIPFVFLFNNLLSPVIIIEYIFKIVFSRTPASIEFTDLKAKTNLVLSDKVIK